MKTIFIVMLLVLMTGCASTGNHSYHGEPSAQKSPDLLEDAPQPQTPATRQKVIRSLIAQHDEWARTRYQLGGMSKNGIDCSGFVHLTYQERFRKAIPRTTELLAEKGYPVGTHQLAPGDLVFFRISPTVRHVGIYIDEDQFLHASKSQGVTISSLQNSYWREHYWQSRRLGQ